MEIPCLCNISREINPKVPSVGGKSWADQQGHGDLCLPAGQGWVRSLSFPAAEEANKQKMKQWRWDPGNWEGVCRGCQSHRGDLWVQYGTWLLDIGIRWGQGRWRGKGWEAKEVVTWDKQRWVGQRYSAELDHSGFKAIVRTDKICCCSFNTFVV